MKGNVCSICFLWMLCGSVWPGNYIQLSLYSGAVKGYDRNGVMLYETDTSSKQTGFFCDYYIVVGECGERRAYDVYDVSMLPTSNMVVSEAEISLLDRRDIYDSAETKLDVVLFDASNYFSLFDRERFN